jgi:glycosyltransferase involved in cell wall biosynthesis
VKALVISHGHPDFSIGGAEIAAYNLFRSLQTNRDVEAVDFLARTNQPSLGTGAISLKSPSEYLWRQDIHDWFLLRSAYPTGIYESLRAFVRLKRPDAIFIHHYAHMGLEMLRELRQELPRAFICLTLHEYMAICLNNGQMVKTASKRLCNKESPEECAACFPDRTAESFWLRKHFIQKHFEAANHFVSPSEFLRQRYIAWGIPAEHISVIENGQPKFDRLQADGNRRASRNRFGFFGQINEFKGVDILLQAMHMMKPEVRRTIQVEIHGANLELQEQRYQELIEKLRVPLIGEGSLRWVGAYEPHELQRRMNRVDWVVIPSIWWENSPMVIQEAFCCRRPVIASGIGGMAEKVRHDVDGLHFEARSALDLADTLTTAATSKGLWERLTGNITQPPTYDDSARRYLELAPLATLRSNVLDDRDF